MQNTVRIVGKVALVTCTSVSYPMRRSLDERLTLMGRNWRGSPGSASNQNVAVTYIADVSIRLKGGGVSAPSILYRNT
jgi:hypothetical protein